MKRCLWAIAVFVPGAVAFAGEGRVIVPDGARVIPDQYIVVLEDLAGRTVAEVSEELVGLYGGRVLHLYDAALEGFALQTTASDAERLAGDARVRFVEQDAEASLAATQVDAPWGLDRVDQRNLPLSGTYKYLTLAGNVHVFVIDSGIRPTHVQFGSRVHAGATFVNDGWGVLDCFGHGTWVAGIIGGSVHGVAKGVVLRPVRVAGCNGGASNSALIAGVNWATANRVTPGVVHVGLGSGASSAVDAAVNKSIAAGLAYVVSAGNTNVNACNRSPARVPAAITVGATTSTDARSSFSNFGSCLDLFAPGTSITSVWASSDTAQNTLSGTSAASAHAAGAAALYLAAHPQASPATVRNALVSSSTPGAVVSPGSGSPNRLLFTLVP